MSNDLINKDNPKRGPHLMNEFVTILDHEVVRRDFQ